MTDFEQRSLELFSEKQKALIEKHRKSFRRWFDPLRKLEPDYREEQIDLIPRCRGCDNDWPVTMVKAWEHGKKPVLVKCHHVPDGRLKEVMVCEDKKMTNEEKRAAAIELVKKAGDPVTENNIQLALKMIDAGVEVE